MGEISGSPSSDLSETKLFFSRKLYIFMTDVISQPDLLLYSFPFVPWHGLCEMNRLKGYNEGQA